MNYMPYAAWDMYGGTTNQENCNYFISWGLMGTLPIIKLFGWINRLLFPILKLRGWTKGS
jgi:hypothetical protein